MPYGGAESDYRPTRWDSFREDYRFTGKEEDVEVGLQYFEKRYLAPGLGRWISPDPLAVDLPGSADLNLYAYVHGAVLRAVDPAGLQQVQPACAGCAASSGPATPLTPEEQADADARDARVEERKTSVEKWLDRHKKVAAVVEPAYEALFWLAVGIEHGEAIEGFLDRIGGRPIEEEEPPPPAVNSSSAAPKPSAEPPANVEGPTETPGAAEVKADPQASETGALRLGKPGISGGPRAGGKTFLRADVDAEIKAVLSENGGVLTCADCSKPMVPSTQSQSGISRLPNEMRRDHVFARAPQDGRLPGPATRQNLELRCAVCNEKKSNVPIGMPVPWMLNANDNGEPLLPPANDNGSAR